MYSIARADAESLATLLGSRAGSTAEELAGSAKWSRARTHRALSYLRSCGWARSVPLASAQRRKRGPKLAWELTPNARPGEPPPPTRYRAATDPEESTP
jgi:hypothetical protein